MSQSQKTLKGMEEETNQLLIESKNLADRTEKVIANVNKNIDLKVSQLQKEKTDLTTQLKERENNLNQINTELKELKDQKSKLLQDLREKDVKIDSLEKEIKELKQKIPH